jgi:seryl-tRNA synthetase
VISGDEISRSAENVKRATVELVQRLGMIDGSYDVKLSEIKNLESKREKLKVEVAQAQDKANKILQEASDQVSQLNKDARLLMEDAQAMKMEAKQERDAAERVKAEANSLMAQALDKQRTADTQYRVVEEKKKRLEEAMRG